MPLKKTVNDSLSRLTGYQVTRAPGTGASLSTRQVNSLGSSSRELAATAKAMSGTVRALEAALKRARAEPPKAAPEAKPSPKPTIETFPRDYDEDYCDIIRAVRPYTMTGNDKLHALISATKYVSRYDVPGAIVEFGAWRGGDMKAVTLALAAADDFSRDLYLYDTFEGLTAAPETVNPGPAVAPVASLEDVQERFATGRYPQDKIHLIKGSAEETIPGQLPEQISILRLDSDWYQSTEHELKHAYDRLVSGGVLMIDDYGWRQGSRNATEQFLERTGDRLLPLRMGSGRVAIKP